MMKIFLPRTESSKGFDKPRYELWERTEMKISTSVNRVMFHLYSHEKTAFGRFT